VSSELSGFTGRVVTLAQKAVVGEPDPAVQKGDGGYADWVIVGSTASTSTSITHIAGCWTVLHEMHGIVGKLGLAVADPPDFTTVCLRKQDLEMRIWRVLLRLSAELDDPARFTQSTQPARIA